MCFLLVEIFSNQQRKLINFQSVTPYNGDIKHQLASFSLIYFNFFRNEIEMKNINSISVFSSDSSSGKMMKILSVFLNLIIIIGNISNIKNMDGQKDMQGKMEM